jgi:glutamate/aspartate transport system substrate-binding protein
MRKFALSLIMLGSLVSWSTASAETTSVTLQAITKSGKIRIGYREAEPPFSYRLPSGEVVGFSIDLCKSLTDHIRQYLKLDKLDVEYVMATPATRFILVKTGNIDIECAATTNTAERRKTVDFSYSNFMTATQFVSRAEDGISSMKDLTGRSVTSASGTVNIDQLNQINREQKLNIAVIPTKNNEESFELVASGRASAFVMDGILLAAMIAQSPDPSKYRLSEETLSEPEPYGLMLRHGDIAFKTLVNDSLREIFAGDEIKALYSKWFTSPIPPSNMNMNLPMSAALRKAYAAPVEFND